VIIVLKISDIEQPEKNAIVIIERVAVIVVFPKKTNILINGYTNVNNIHLIMQ
jgi:hypothetical protein